MEISRVQPYSNIDVDFTIPEVVASPSEITVTITDMSDLSIQDVFTYEGVAGEVIQYPLYAKYDAEYRVVITAQLEGEEVIFDDTYEVVRPYVDPVSLGTTASEIAEYALHEEIARAVIDSVIPEGFYYKKKSLHMVGLGADYLPIWVDAKKLLKLYENNVLVYDAAEPELYETNYQITSDKTALTVAYPDRLNRAEGATLVLPAAPSDLLDSSFTYRGFVNSFDYVAVLEIGYTSVPNDIVRATKLLIEDIKCGKLEYYKRYISDYNTDQFKLKFDDRFSKGLETSL